MTEARRFFGPYELLQPLGQGAMGDIWLARPRDRKRGVPSPVVVKRLHAELHSEERFIRRFTHEARIASAIDSPHVVKIYDAGSVGAHLYIAMEYIEGWALSRIVEQAIASGSEIPLGSALDIAIDALRGLEALHSARDRTGASLGIVHRDIAPKNLMVSETGKTRLIDLGIGMSNMRDWKTAPGLFVGSPGYMAPEQVQGQAEPRSDLYALATVLFELLALEPYIRRGSLPEMLARSLAPRFRPLSAIRKEVPAELDKVLERALAPDPKDRYPTAAALLGALADLHPRAGAATNVETLISDPLWQDLTEVKSEVTRLLAEPATAEGELGEEKETTVVLAARPGVGGPTEERTSAELGPSGTVMHPRTQPGLAPVRRAWLAGLSIAMAALLALAFAATRDLFSPEETTLSLSPDDAPDEAVPAPSVHASARKGPSEIRREPASLPPKKHTGGAKKPASGASPPVSVSVVEAPAPTPDVTARLKTLRRRAASARAEAAGPDEKKKLMVLSSEIEAALQAPEPPSEARVRVLEAELDRATSGNGR